MKEIIINNQQISVKEYNGQRVTTFRDIDRIHERPEGTARRNFNSNKEHLTEGTDYFRVSANEIRTQNILEIGKKQTQDIVFLTETGYLMLVKSMNDPVAWKIQRALVDNYFHAGREQAPDPFTKTWRGVPVLTIAEASDLTGRAVSKDMIRHYLGKIPGIRTRTRYSVCVVTSATGGSFRMLGQPCCSPSNNLASIDGTAPAAPTA